MREQDTVYVYLGSFRFGHKLETTTEQERKREKKADREFLKS